MPTYGLDFSGIDSKKGKYGYVDFKFWFGKWKTACLVDNFKMYNNTGYDSGLRDIDIPREQKCGVNWRAKTTIDQHGP